MHNINFSDIQEKWKDHNNNNTNNNTSALSSALTITSSSTTTTTRVIIILIIIIVDPITDIIIRPIIIFKYNGVFIVQSCPYQLVLYRHKPCRSRRQLVRVYSACKIKVSVTQTILIIIIII